MALFGLGKKKETTCSCGGRCESTKEVVKSEVKVLGSGCKKCNELEAVTKEALESLNMDSAIEHVTDFSEIATYGVMSTPALVIDGKVVAMGKVLKVDEVIEILKKVRG